MSKKIEWLQTPEPHDYIAALSYLSLHFPIEEAGWLLSGLKASPVMQFKAKDILRASGLHLLPETNSHIEHDLEKIDDGKKLSPILLVRGKKLLIADGFHRVCAVYMHDEDAFIPAQITGRLE